MFTGLIEEMGTISELRKNAGSTDLYIQCTKIPGGLQVGDSISVNGVCLTATKFNCSYFSATATPETLACTNLGQLKSGSKVNLERSVSLQTRLGGHIVQGHIDGTGEVTAVIPEGDSQRWEIAVPTVIARHLISKGSVAINGVSLTVASLVGNDRFTVALIPKTVEMTTFKFMQTGDTVNIETDMIGKYIYRFMETSQGAV